MIIRLILFFALMLGGFYVMGHSFGMESNQAFVFVGGLLMFVASIFMLMHFNDSATKKSTWE